MPRRGVKSGRLGITENVVTTENDMASKAFMRFGALLEHAMHVPARAFSLLAALSGAALFFFLFAEILPPDNIAWILNDGWDTFQHYIGWALYRNAPWTFPIGINGAYGYPVGLPIIYSDSIPLIAIPLKALSFFLPATFQYLGLWTLLSFVLQGALGFYLSRLVVKNDVLAYLGSIFFIASPIMIYRIGGHASLSGHWLILVALLLLLRPHRHLQHWQWTLVFILSVLVHPYFLLMNGAIMVMDVLQLLLVHRSIRAKDALMFLVLSIAFTLMVSYAQGMFYIGKTHSANLGYTMNLNALWNPYWGDWSTILPNRPTAPYQYEGMNYLGLGIILLLLYGLLRHYPWISARPWGWALASFWPIILVSAALFVLSVGNHVFWDAREVVSFVLPDGVSNVLNIVRSTGRLFWPVYYLLLLLALFAVRGHRMPIAVPLIVVALSVQLYDISGHLTWHGKLYENARWESPLKDARWKKFASSYRHISFIPRFPFTTNIAQSGFVPIALFAAENAMTLNDGYVARPIKGLGKHIVSEASALESGKVDRNTLYILTHNASSDVGTVNTNHFFGTVDGYTILAPYSHQ